jgi:DNA-binding CsgD family transcriptional regulator
MRLGITDSEKIAKFLGFSVNTVYTYKTKLKHKAIDRDNFDEKIMHIKAL